VVLDDFQRTVAFHNPPSNMSPSSYQSAIARSIITYNTPCFISSMCPVGKSNRLLANPSKYHKYRLVLATWLSFVEGCFNSINAKALDGMMLEIRGGSMVLQILVASDTFDIGLAPFCSAFKELIFLDPLITNLNLHLEKPIDGGVPIHL
jgi:hypothetical protein